MNIILIPHTVWRHFSVALVSASVTGVVWWAFLNLTVGLGPWLYSYGFLWQQELEGPYLLGALAGSSAFASLLAEGSLRRTAIQWRAAYALVGLVFSAVPTALWTLGVDLALPYVVGERLAGLVADTSLATLRYSVLQWMGAGFFAGMGALIGRYAGQLLDFIRTKVNERKKGTIPDWVNIPPAPGRPGFFPHLAGGLTAGLMAGAMWQTLGLHLLRDLYLASGVASVGFGFFYGLLVWGIPSDLYAGWVRVLSAERYGLRIPIDRVDGSASERFVGHYPRGLDIHLPEELGVAELHASFVVDSKHRYTVRGLSQRPTLVRRMLERIDLTYDPRSPAPLETQLKMEDIILLGDAKGPHTEVEFILLPKEEK